MGMILVIVIGGAVLWFWNDTLKARENMLHRCRVLLRDMDMQLLDQTVAIHRFGWRRNASERLVIYRTYHFEFSTNGQDRWLGRATLLGRTLDTLQIDTPEGTTIMGDATGSERIH